jgi:hypothetical protein
MGTSLNDKPAHSTAILLRFISAASTSTDAVTHQQRRDPQSLTDASLCHGGSRNRSRDARTLQLVSCKQLVDKRECSALGQQSKSNQLIHESAAALLISFLLVGCA